MRLLWLDANFAFWIDINAKAAWPEHIAIDEILAFLVAQELQVIDDPYSHIILRPVDKESTNWKKCEKAWDIIREHINNPDLFYRASRGKLVATIVKQHQVTNQSVNRYIRRFWQRGMNKYTLLPDYIHSGGAGKTRDTSKSKLGRKRSISSGTGTNITPDVARIFRQCIESYLLKESSSSIAGAYAVAADTLSATEKHSDPTTIPTLRQFRYFYDREYNFETRIKSQLSDIEFEKEVRPITSTSTAETLGPGFRYQIDATVADLYLLAEYDRSKIVGRPVIYFVIDVFSRMITGMYVGFEGPSWISAMMAVANAGSNKVEYCKKYGIDITEQDWPVTGLPNIILADQGEFKGKNVETFIEANGGWIENAKARRGDAKGIVENKFKTVQQDFKPYTEGIVEPVISKKRGGKDYRLGATLTLSEFTQKIINIVLYHNNKHVMTKYDRCEGMPTDIPNTPRLLWNWGIANLTGRLRTVQQDLLYINLLPHTTATVSDLGIRVFGAFYICQEVLQQGWLHRKQGSRPAKVTIAYDPRLADHIYIRPEGKLDQYWVGNLSDRSRRFKSMTFWDMWRLTKEENKTQADAIIPAAIAKGKMIKSLEETSAVAAKKKPKLPGVSKAEQVRGIKDNKQQEKAQERASTAFRPPSNKQETPAKVIPIKGGDTEDYSYPDMTDILFEDDNDD